LKALLAAATLLLLATPTLAQSPASKPPPAAPITLDQSVVPINGPWKFTTGDSPIDPATHQPLWSQPTFDDSSWQNYLLDPDHPAITLTQAVQPIELPGWQSHGHPGYTGYGWYRIRLQPPAGAQPLALLMPANMDDAYAVYVDGEKIGNFGRLDGWRLFYTGEPMLYTIPPAALSSGHPITLSLRFWVARLHADPIEENLAGGLRDQPLLGPPDLVQVFLQSFQQLYGQIQWLRIIPLATFFAVGVISLFLFFFSRSQREYLWAGISLISCGLEGTADLIQRAQQSIVPYQGAIAFESITTSVAFFTLPLAAMYLLSVPRPLWRRLNAVPIAWSAAFQCTSMAIILNFVQPTAAIDRFFQLEKFQDLPFALLLLAISIDGLRTIGRRAWLRLLPGVLFVCVRIPSSLVDSDGPFGPLIESLYSFVPLSVLAVFLVSFIRQQRENGRIVDDLKQAAEVQQVILPESHLIFPNLTIETEYRPAREVGGDFFQIIPHATDGSLLIVAGDVTGKGLQAGMTVALLVGAIRSSAETNPDPLSILEALNRRLLGRKSAQATCLALSIAPDGQVTLANAGHLPPYLNGTPVDMEGALPLGMIDGADFSLTHFHLKPTDNLVLISDGILEATDQKGQLFGFDRIQQLLQQNTPIATLADQAQHFGQEDDISLVSLTRTA
jgi:hypothetical protein